MQKRKRKVGLAGVEVLGDEAAEIQRARGRRALQARMRIIIFSLSEMGSLGNQQNRAYTLCLWLPGTG